MTSDDRNAEVDYMYKTLTETRQSALYLQEQLKGNRASAQYPPDTLGGDLRTVSNLILSGCDTRVYYLSLTGFDTHVNQRNTHQRLLKNVSDGLASFVKEMRENSLMQDVTILCFSEFGRRVKQNASGGTDHGAGNNLFMISEHLQVPGFFNPVPDLRILDEGDIPYTVDFRNVYADILQQWLDVRPDVILGQGMEPLGLLG